MLAVTLPDGSHATIAAMATDVFGAPEPAIQPGVAVLSVDGLRRLRALVAARSHDRKNRGTRRRTI